MNKLKSLNRILVVVLIMNLLISQSFYALPGAAAQVDYKKLPKDNIAKLQDVPGRSPGFKDGEILLKVKGGSAEENRVLKKYRMNLVQRVPRTGYVLASVKNQNFVDTLGRLQQEDSVVHAQPNYIYRTFGFPNDPQYARQWALKNINADKTWNSAQTGKGASPVTVAVLDTGIDVNHPDLKTRLVTGTNTVNPLKSTRDNDGHGTHVAGIISALTNNQTGVAGVTGTAPVRVMPIKVFDDDMGSDVSISNGIIWAVDHGARVINMSFGSYSKSEILNEAIEYAHKKGVVLVAAAGNWASEEVSYPAAVSKVMAVSAINNKGKLAEFSSFGPLIDICAPGEEIYSTYWDPYKGSTYTEMSGTSMASPMVAGLAALLLVKNPKLTNDEVRQIIEVSASDLGDAGWDTRYGHGKIDVDKAMSVSLSRIDDSNSSSGKAISLKNGVPLKEKIHFGSDRDWFKIGVPQKGHLQVEVLPAGKVSPAVEVYDKTGKLLASFNSGSQPEKSENKDSLTGSYTAWGSEINQVQYKVAEAVYGLVTNLDQGDYYIKVFGNHYRWSDREYTVTARVIDSSGLAKDLNEPNNSYERARKISIGARVSGSIDAQWDQDWYKVELPGKIYKVQVKTPEGLNLAVEIENESNYEEYDGEANYEDYYASWFYQILNKSGVGGDEEGIIALPQSKKRVYYLRVYDTGGGAYNGNYTLTVSPYNLRPDEFEPNNSYTSATPLELSKSVRGNFDNVKDSDWYLVETTGTGILKVNLRRPDNVWCEINIYKDGIDNPVEQHFKDFEYGLESDYNNDTVESETKVFPGKYYIEIKNEEKLISGDYKLQCDFSAFEFIDTEINDSRSGAVKLALGEVKQGTIHPVGDVDGYELKIEKIEPLIFSVTPSNELDSMVVVMREPDKNSKDSAGFSVEPASAYSEDPDEPELEIVSMIDSGGKGRTETGVFQPTKPGTYFLFIGGSGKEGGKYTVTIKPFKVQADKWEDNGSLIKAKPFQVGTGISPTFMGTEDVDWFKVYVPGAGVLTSDMTLPHDIDGVLEIYDKSGRLLSKSDQSMVGEKEYAVISIQSAGYYYIKVYDYLGNSSVQPYNLVTRFTASKQPKKAVPSKKG